LIDCLQVPSSHFTGRLKGHINWVGQSFKAARQEPSGHLNFLSFGHISLVGSNASQRVMLSTQVLSQQRIWFGLHEGIGGHKSLLLAQEPSGQRISP
jgi:hypothetical protein